MGLDAAAGGREIRTSVQVHETEVRGEDGHTSGSVPPHRQLLGRRLPETLGIFNVLKDCTYKEVSCEEQGGG